MAVNPQVDLPEPTHDPADVRDLADEILSRPQYEGTEESSGPLDGIGEWLADQLSRLASSFGVDASFPVWLAWLVLAALVLLAVAIVLRLRHTRGRPGPSHVRSPGRVVVENHDGLVDWSAEAGRCEAQGQWLEGLLYRYRALVAELVERRVIGDAVGRTAGEYVREVAATLPAAAPAFTAATELFERAWYGGAPTGPPERDRFQALAADVVRSRDQAPASVGRARRVEVVR